MIFKRFNSGSDTTLDPTDTNAFVTGINFSKIQNINNKKIKNTKTFWPKAPEVQRPNPTPTFPVEHS